MCVWWTSNKVKSNLELPNMGNFNLKIAIFHVFLNETSTKLKYITFQIMLNVIDLK